MTAPRDARGVARVPQARLVVRGRVTHADARAAPAVRVIAYDQDMVARQRLGATETGPDGTYSIDYTEARFARDEKASADLVVTVLDRDGEEFAETPISFNAPAEAEIDVVLPATGRCGLSEYERYRSELAGIICDVPLGELTEENIDFCAGETGIPRERIRFLVLEAQWQRYDPPEAVLYGLLRAGLPDRLPELLREPPERLAAARETAVREGFIPDVDDEQAVLDRLAAAAVGVANDPPDGSFTDVLDAVGLDDRKRRAFQWMAFQAANRSDFWERAAEVLDPETVSTLQFGFAAARLAAGHRETTRRLVEWRGRVGASRPSDVVKLDRDGWSELLAGMEGELPEGYDDLESHREELQRRVEHLYPSESVAQYLVDDQEYGSRAFTTFVTANPGFDLFATDLRTFDADLAGIEDPAALYREVRAYQLVGRVLGRTTPVDGRFRAMKLLLGAGFTSGTQIALTMGESDFVRRMTGQGMDGVLARRIYGAAATTVHTVQMQLLDGRDQIDVPGLLVGDGFDQLRDDIREAARSSGPAAFSELWRRLFPTGPDVAAIWGNLFGIAGGCTCQHCQSVFGPAAYFTDLLQFLAKAPSGSAGHGPLDELLGRRPDLQHLFLDCRNTNVTLPYVDLVNEILGDAVLATAENRDNLPVDPSTADPDAYREAVAVYQTENPDGRSDAELRRVLRARPQHERTAAFALLRTAGYPWALPFDPDHDRVRDLTAHLGVSRWRWLETFGRPAEEVARLHLDLDPQLWRFLTRTDVTDDGIAEVWGPHADALARGPVSVPAFLRWTGLTNDELDELGAADSVGLDALTVDRSADPCDINRHTVTIGGGIAGLDAVYRFVRLTRALALPVGMLHGALTWLGVEAITGESLVALSTMLRLADRLGVPVERLAAAARGDLPALLGYTATEYDSVVALTGRDPWPPDRPADLVAVDRLAELKERLSRSGLSVAALRYLLAHRDTAPPTQAPLESELSPMLDAVERDLDAEKTVPDADEERIDDAIATTLGEQLEVAPAVVRALAGARGDGRRFDVLLGYLGEVEPGRGREAALDVLVWLRTCVTLVRSLSLTGDDLVRIRRLQASGALADVLDFDDLPTTPLADPAPVLAGWERLADLVELRKRLPSTDRDLLDHLTESSPDFDRLADQTGWDPDVLVRATSWLGLAGSFAEPETYRLLLAVMTAVRSWPAADSGDPLGGLLLLGDPATASPELVASLERAVERAAGTGWPDVVTPMADRWRERQRDALLAWLITHGARGPGGELVSFTDAGDVYAHFLIDVEMSACQLTARIKQAAATVQLFVQRVLLRLENPEITSREDDHWDQWEWRKNYRVWEAAMKVFIHPENWLEPEFRDVKSPQFRQLEDELLQGETTDDTVDAAYRHYLEGLDELSGLDYRAIYEEVGDRSYGQHNPGDDPAAVLSGLLSAFPTPSALHVFARTASEPYAFYYRRRRPTLEWEPWERLDLRIESDHLLPVVVDGRLLLMWAVVREQQETKGGENQDKRTYVDIGLSWSERLHDRWSAVRGSESAPVIRLFVEALTPFSEEVATAALSESLASHYRRSAVSGLSFLVSHHNGLAVDVFGPIEVDNPYASGTRIQLARAVLDTCRSSWRLDKTLREHALLAKPGGWRPAGRRYLLEPSTPGGLRWQLWDPPLSRERFANDDSPRMYDDDTVERHEWIDSLPSWRRRALNRAGQDEYHRKRTVELLGEGVHRAVLLPPHDTRSYVPVGLSINSHWFLVDRPWRSPLILGLLGERYTFESLDHPFRCTIREQLYANGVPGILAPGRGSGLDRQELAGPALRELSPTDAVANPELAHEFDFSLRGSQSLYNWELFFHAPLLIADRLSKEGRFEEAHRWFEYLFDPADPSVRPAPAKYFRTKPLYQALLDPPRTIEDLLRALAAGDRELLDQIEAWQEDPFNPHAIARLRVLAYAKNLVMKYLDNLIAWADSLFTRDTIESINEATQLYLRASRVLGPRQVFVEREDTQPATYALVRSGLDALSNFLTDVETGLPADSERVASARSGSLPDLMLYFCVPANDKLLGYWDTIEDRLFKIRNCMNIEGIVRELALYEPPIDPALLVRARAAGLDLREIVGRGLSPMPPTYRYSYLFAKAVELCETVRGFGAQLLAALEKKDAEGVSLMRTRHDVTIAGDTIRIREQQIEEAEEALEALRSSQAQAQRRYDYYTSREKISDAEQKQLDMIQKARVYEIAAELHNQQAAVAHAIPDTAWGFAAAVEFGGSNLGSALRGAAGLFQAQAGQRDREASLAGLQGERERRWDDWQHQGRQAELEVQQLERQIVAAEIRLAIARNELAMQRKQLTHAEEVADFFAGKFTSEEMYGWMSSQLMAMHYQAYRLARDAAERAQAAAEFELGKEPGQLDQIQLNHWDPGRRGLLASDRLHHDLRRLDAAFISENKRAFELTKHVSLRLVDPLAFIRLKATGSCELTLPEALFEADHPGHHQRLIRRVAVTIPAVTGPYTNINGTLTLRRHWIRRAGSPAGDLTESEEGLTAAEASIALSHGRSDRGRFDDTGRDERLEPFELHGAVSKWELSLPAAANQFDLDTITDVVLSIDYTARRSTAEPAEPAEPFVPSVQLLSLRHQFPSDWAAFTAATDAPAALRIELTHDQFPYAARGRTIVLDGPGIDPPGPGLWLMAATRPGPGQPIAIGSPDNLQLTEPATTSPSGVARSLAAGGAGTVEYRDYDPSGRVSISPGSALTLTFSGTPGELVPAPAQLDDLWLLLGFHVER